jgi:hypothetical protein
VVLLMVLMMILDCAAVTAAVPGAWSVFEDSSCLSD